MALETTAKNKLKRFIRRLDVVRGRHTELVTVYIPAGYDMNKIINHLQQEQGTASNIKDKTTRQNVIDSLERMIRHLRLFKSTPPNGLAVFSGNVSTKEGRPDLQVFSLEPPEAMKTRMYRCDQTFITDPLKEMVDYKETYGLIVMDKREATIGILKGSAITVLFNMTSGVPGKTKAGGQCLLPDTAVSMADGQYLSLEEVEVGDEVLSFDFAKKEFIASKIKNKWLRDKDKIFIIKVEDEIIECSADHILFMYDGGEKPAESLAVGEKLISQKGNAIKIKEIRVIDKAAGMIDIEVENGNFVANGVVVHNSSQRFARLREGAAKEFYNRIAEVANKEFLPMLNLKGIIVGGPGPTKEAFFSGNYLNNNLKIKTIAVKDIGYTDEYGLRDLVDKSQDLLAQEVIIQEKKIMEKFFTMLAKEEAKTAYGKENVLKALEIKAVETVLLSEIVDDDTIELFETKCQESGAELQLISTDTREGVQLKDMGGFAAMLRYPRY